MLCEQCQLREATVSATVFLHGHRSIRHLCRQCADPLLATLPSPPPTDPAATLVIPPNPERPETEQNYHNMRAVYETLRHDETNAYLALGWCLLKILVKDDEGQYVGFLLGWPGIAPPQRPSYDEKIRRFFIGDTEPRKYFTEDENSA